MAELVEGSIYNQINAIKGWALTAYQESIKKTPNIDAILENLKQINLQARKLEWRGKCLDDLPKRIDKHVKNIEEMEDDGLFLISEENRSYLEETKKYVMRLEKLKKESEDLVKKITQLRAAVVTLRKIKKDKGLNDSSKLTIRVLFSLAAEAIKISENLREY